jgi:hypothetical protein
MKRTAYRASQLPEEEGTRGSLKRHFTRCKEKKRRGFSVQRLALHAVLRQVWKVDFVFWFFGWRMGQPVRSLGWAYYCKRRIRLVRRRLVLPSCVMYAMSCRFIH